MRDLINNVLEYIQSNPKDFINICFWVLTGFLAIITYINAKKTLFNPIRSEMVKYQMKIITDFVDNHTAKGQNFDNSIDYSNLLKINYETDYLLSILNDEILLGDRHLDEIDNERLNYCIQNLSGLFEIRVKDNQLKLELVYGDFETTRQYVQTKFIKDKEANNSELYLQRLFLTNKFYSFYTDPAKPKVEPFYPGKNKNRHR
jgi:hypothetical protein